MTSGLSDMPLRIRMLLCYTAFTICSLASTSCSELAMEDVSSAHEYSAAVGRTFRTKEDVLAIGITTDKNYQKRVDYVVLVASPGFSGPEVVTREQLRKDSIIRVVRVLKAASFFSAKVVYVVELAGSDRFKGAEIRVTLTGTVTDSNFGLDKSIYEKMS